MDKEEFFSTKWSKFNKTNFEACLKAGIFDDWSNSREELKEIKQIKYKQTNQMDLFVYIYPGFDKVLNSSLGKVDF